MGELPEGRTLVVAAMREEIATLRQRAAGARAFAHVDIAVTGEGAERAARGMSRLLERVRPRATVVVGFSGALSPDLAPGALVVGTEVRGPAGSFRAGDAWLSRAATLVGARPAVVLTHRSIVTETGEKARLARRLHGGSQRLPAVVDLESSIYVAAAVRAGVPWLVLRAVSDAANETLPPLIGRCRGRDGGLRRGRLLASSLLRPRSWSQLWMLRNRARRCAATLADAVEALLGHSHALS